jgi:hypothetical protein
MPVKRFYHADINNKKQKFILMFLLNRFVKNAFLATRKKGQLEFYLQKDLGQTLTRMALV